MSSRQQESLTQRWLRQITSSYPHAERVYLDIDAALARFPTLLPKSDVYTFDDGRTQLLLCVHGLLAIAFKQASYNIPIAVWITKEYPRRPPIVYVVPTSDMLIKAGKFVDVSGRCNIEYMRMWEKKSEGCHLLALLEAMQHQFSLEPPVYAKPQTVPSSSLNAASASSSSEAGRETVVRHDRPILPPKPTSVFPSGPLPPTPPVAPKIHSQIPITRVPSEAPAPPPRPPYSHPAPLRQSPGPPVYRALVPLVPASTQPLPPKPVSYREPVRSSSSSGTTTPLPPPAIGNSPFPATLGPPLNSAWSHQPGPIIPPKHPLQPQVDAEANIALQYTIPLPDYLEEDSGPDPQAVSTIAPPPRPPNPELINLHGQIHAKLMSELAALTKGLALDAERLRKHQADLLVGEPTIRDEMARLEAVRDVCRNVASRMRGTVDQAERNIAELRRKGDPEVDELVCSTTIVYNQLISLVAEDNAIEDTIYHLHRALNAGRIDLERFLRSARALAEEQFMKRALIGKIQAGLPSGSHWT